MKSFFLAITHKIKHVKQLIKSGFYTVLYAIFSGLAYAQTANPFGGSDDLLPTEAKGKGLFPQMIIIFAYVLRLLVICAMAVGVGFLLFSLYKAFNESRDRNEWGNFITTVLLAVLMIVIAVIIAGLGWTWSETLINMAG